MRIQKAVRGTTYMKLAVTGPTGSGKTWAAIGLAKGLSDDGRVCVIDTENNSASFYAGTTDEPGQWSFDVINLSAPFTPQAYIEAVGEAVRAGYSVVVIDSLSHEWAASGGILDVKAQKDQRGGNSYTNWNGVKQTHNSFIESILQSPIHIVATMRSKMEYVLETTVNKYGKEVQAPKRVGLEPISSDDIEYEFSVVFDINRSNHMATASKDRTNMFGSKSLFLTPQVGRQLKDWMEGATFGIKAKAEAPAPVPAATPTPAKRSRKKEQPQQQPEAPIANQNGAGDGSSNEPGQTLSPDQRGQIRLYLQSYRIDTIAFLNWAKSRGLIATDAPEFGIEDIRAEHFGYLESLFAHEKSRLAFIQHLASMTAKTA